MLNIYTWPDKIARRDFFTSELKKMYINNQNMHYSKQSVQRSSNFLLCIFSPFQREHVSHNTYIFLVAHKQLDFFALLKSTLTIAEKSLVKADYPSGWQYHNITVLPLREAELTWGLFWPIYFNKNSLLVFSMIYKFITNFLFYFLTISLNHSMMECGCWCPLVFYWVVFFFVVKIMQLSFMIIIKWDRLE